MILVDLTGYDGFLLVAAGHTPGHRHRSLTASDVVLFDQALGIGADLAEFNKAVFLEFGIPVPLQHQVFLQGVIQYQAVLVPVLGNVAHTRVGTVSDAGLGNIHTAKGEAALAVLLQSGQRMNKFGLTVALDACQTHNFAGTDLEGNVFHRVALVGLGGDGNALHIQHHIAGSGSGLVHLQLDVTAHHEPGHLLDGGIFHIHGAHVLALAQDGAAVRHGLDFRQLVGNEEDGFSFFLEAPHDVHQLVNLLGGQDGGGLVENQDLIVSVEHLQNLHSLLHTNGDVGDLGVRVDPQAVPLGQGHDLFTGFLLLEHSQMGILHAQDDVVQHGEVFHQLEVLMDHANVQGGGVVGVADLNDLTVFLDDTFLRLI